MDVLGRGRRRYCDPLARLDRADRLSARERESSVTELSREGFNAPRILTDWIKGIMDDVRRSWALTVNPRG